MSYTEKYEAFTSSIIAQITAKINEKVANSTQTSNTERSAKCIPITDLYIELEESQLAELHTDSLVSLDGLHYSFEFIPLSELCQIADSI